MEAGRLVGSGEQALGKLPEASKGRTRDQVAKRVGMSGKTYEKIATVVAAAAAGLAASRRLLPGEQANASGGAGIALDIALALQRHQVGAHAVGRVDAQGGAQLTDRGRPAILGEVRPDGGEYGLLSVGEWSGHGTGVYLLRALKDNGWTGPGEGGLNDGIRKATD